MYVHVFTFLVAEGLTSLCLRAPGPTLGRVDCITVILPPIVCYENIHIHVHVGG